MTLSIESTLRAPEPIPRRPEADAGDDHQEPRQGDASWKVRPRSPAWEGYEPRGRDASRADRATGFPPERVHAPRERHRGEEDDAEDHRDRGRRRAGREESARERAESRRDLEEEADPDVREALPDVGRRGAARRRDHGDEGGPDRVLDVDAEAERQERDENDAAPEARERADEAGGGRAGKEECRESEDVHVGTLPVSEALVEGSGAGTGCRAVATKAAIFYYSIEE